MSKFRQFIPFSLMSAVAAVLALIIAWEPEPAVAERPEHLLEVLERRNACGQTGGLRVSFHGGERSPRAGRARHPIRRARGPPTLGD